MTTGFSEFLRSLAERRVEYLLVSGYAVAHHGYPRPTGDIDIWVRPDDHNAGRIVEALREFGFEALRRELFTAADSIV